MPGHLRRIQKHPASKYESSLSLPFVYSAPELRGRNFEWGHNHLATMNLNQNFIPFDIPIEKSCSIIIIFKGSFGS